MFIPLRLPLVVLFFDEVMVSTDDQEIAQEARNSGAAVPFLRSEHGANGHATTFEVIEEVMNSNTKQDKEFDAACCTYPTGPLTGAKDLMRFFEFYKKSDFDCVFPVIRYGYPIQRGLRVNATSQMNMIHPEHLITRSKDLEATYRDAGQFYWFNVGRLLKVRQLWIDTTGVLEIKETAEQDMDDLEDWDLAEIKYQISNDQ